MTRLTSRGAVVAFPQAARPIGSGYEWDHERDLPFLEQLIGELVSRYSPPGDRVCVSGMSGGARMSCVLAAARADLVSAVGAVAGLRSGAPQHSDAPGFDPRLPRHGGPHQSLPGRKHVTLGRERRDQRPTLGGDQLLARAARGGRRQPHPHPHHLRCPGRSRRGDPVHLEGRRPYMAGRAPGASPPAVSRTHEYGDRRHRPDLGLRPSARSRGLTISGRSGRTPSSSHAKCMAGAHRPIRAPVPFRPAG